MCILSENITFFRSLNNSILLFHGKCYKQWYEFIPLLVTFSYKIIGLSPSIYFSVKLYEFYQHYQHTNSEIMSSFFGKILLKCSQQFLAGLILIILSASTFSQVSQTLELRGYGGLDEQVLMNPPSATPYKLPGMVAALQRDYIPLYPYRREPIAPSGIAVARVSMKTNEDLDEISKRATGKKHYFSPLSEIYEALLLIMSRNEA